MRTDCQHPDCLKTNLKHDFRYCHGACMEWAQKRLKQGLKDANVIDDPKEAMAHAVAVLNKFAAKWHRKI